ncbi:hypothetical protein K0M31_000239 [Melipona bicolor]|uniref:Uncharacterized protein n=1 Tax=Melipona bicolor TaxID=60889 RepID=A0AA40GDE6_9HYME|nr:hypothetical protein K0M31_000239 [Melipona bicolor]
MHTSTIETPGTGVLSRIGRIVLINRRITKHHGIRFSVPIPLVGRSKGRSGGRLTIAREKEERHVLLPKEESQSVHFSPQTRLVALNRSHLPVVVCSERDEGANGGASCLIAQC